MRRFTVKEVRTWMKTLEENRYKKVYNSDCRRVSWMANNMNEDGANMPISMRKKWTKAQYGRERYLAKEFIKNKINTAKLRESIVSIVTKELLGEKKKLNESKMVQFQIKEIDKKKVKKVLDKLRLKMGKDYDFGVGKGAIFVLELDKKYQNKVLELFVKSRINVRG